MEKRSRISSYFLTILSAVLILNFGCSDDFFNEKAGDRITPEQHYQSVIDLEVSMYGAIVPLQEALPKLIMYDGLRSDMMQVTPNADAYLNELNDHVISVGNPYTNPADLYKVIININEVLANVGTVAAKDKQADSLYVRAVTGALIGMRSWAYLTISRMYGKVAYIEDNLTSIPSDITQKVIIKYDLIDTLINQIKPYIHDNSTGTKYFERRFGNYVNTKALLGELYLEKNDYVNATEWLKKACESYDNHPILFKGDKTYKELAWANIFFNAESQGIETICVVPFSSDEGQFNPLPAWTYDQYVVKPTTVLVDSFMSQLTVTGDTGDIFRGQDYTFYEDSISGFSVIAKYLIPLLESYSSDIIISRATDIHLLLAEAYNRMGDATSQKFALMLLNDGVNKLNPKPAEFSRWSNNLGVRGRVSLQSRIVPLSMADPDSIINLIEDFIIAERAMELAFEGKRWNDLVRIAERRGDPAYLADRVAAKYPLGSGDYNRLHNLLMDPASWYLPFK